MTPDEGQISVREFNTFRDAIVNAISDAAKQVNSRLDSMEDRIDSRFGNVQKTTNDLLRIAGEHSAKLNEHQRRHEATERAIGHRHKRKDDGPSGDNEAITYKDLKRFFLIGSVIFALSIGATAFFVLQVADKVSK